MIEKLPFEITKSEYEGKVFTMQSHTSPYDMQVKINELVDTVNGILDYAPLEMAMKAEPKTPAENVQQISYIAPGDTTVFYGAGCSVEFDTPLPKGTRITIKSTTKGGDNDEQ